MSWGETLFLKKVIDGAKRFVGSDVVIVADFKNSRQSTFKPKISGAIQIKIDVNIQNTSGIDILTVRLYNSSGEYVEKKQSVSADRGKTYYIPFDIVAKEEYSVNVSKSGSYHTLGAISLCGSVVDYNYFEIQ